MPLDSQDFGAGKTSAMIPSKRHALVELGLPCRMADMHLTPVEVHVSCMSPVVNSTHIPSDSPERTAMAPSWSFLFMHRKDHSTIMVQVVSVTLLHPLNLGVYSGSGTTEETMRLELLFHGL